MTENLYILYVGSINDDAWRWSITDSFLRKKWNITEKISYTFDNNNPTIYHILPCQVSSIPANSRVVLLSDKYIGLSSKAILSLTNDVDSRLSIVASLISDATRKKWLVVDASSMCVVLPVIGAVTRGQNDSSSSSLVASISSRISDYERIISSGKIFWEWETYQVLEGDVNKSVLSVDLTGRSRTLVYGPYLAVPSGEWRCTVSGHTKTVGMPAKLVFEWGAVTDFTSVELETGTDGHFSVSLDHIFYVSVAAEFRIYLTSAVFHSSIALNTPQILLVKD